MRAFIAIELPAETKDELIKLQDKLKSSGADVKWVSPENIHLTLKFLGEIDESQLEKIKEIINTVVGLQAAFPLRINSLGAFPKINFPRVIWIGVSEGDAQVKTLAKTLEEKLQKLGFPKEERAFSSHITIGRVRSPKNKDNLISLLQKFTEEFAEDNLQCRITKICLFKSTLAPSGPFYEALKEAKLTTS